MKRFCAFGVLTAAVLGWAGCQPPASSLPPTGAAAAPTNSAAAAAVAAPVDPRIPTQPNPRLQTMKLWVGPKSLVTELALSGLQQQTGMMFRTNMPEEEGMLFPSVYPEHKAFWMMNTRLPLSLAYIDPNGAILEIYDLEPFNTNSVESVSANVQYVLETTQGWFKRNNITPGTVVSTEFGPLRKVFLPKQP